MVHPEYWLREDRLSQRKAGAVSKRPITTFRMVGHAEAVSFILLLGIAMPLKYLADMPLAVRIVGSIHGGLFILYLLAAFNAGRAAQWGATQFIEAVVASLLPFGPFVIDRKWREQADRLEPIGQS